MKFWENDIKPYLKNTYPFQQNGIFTVNADVKFLIKEIDDLIAKGNNASNTNNNTDSKNTINEQNNNNNAHLRMTWNKKHEKTEKGKKEDDKLPTLNIDNEKKEKEKLENNLNKNNKKDINRANIGRNRNNNFYDKTSSLTYTSTISTSKINTIASLFNEIDKQEDLKKNETIKAKSFMLMKEINPNFCEEFETERVTIVHKKHNNKDISMMTFNLFLKKIVVGNFYNEYVLYATNFAEQCYYFIKKEIVIKKVINCYQYYNKIKVPFNQRKNLIYFLDLLVIKMYFHYNKINLKDEVLILLKNFYNEIINELKQIISKSKSTSEKIQTFFKDGINALKEGVNNINKNIKMANRLTT